MPDVVTFVENRRKDRVLARITDAVPLGLVLTLFGPFDARKVGGYGSHMSVTSERDNYLISIPVGSYLNKHQLKRAIRAKAKKSEESRRPIEDGPYFSGPVTGRMQCKEPNLAAEPRAEGEPVKRIVAGTMKSIRSHVTRKGFKNP